MTTAFILAILYFIITLPLVLVFVASGAGEKNDQPRIAEYEVEKSNAD